jgi:probable HAF family extracellular repeat protein
MSRIKFRASARGSRRVLVVIAALAIAGLAWPAASMAGTRYRLVDLGLDAVANSLDAAGDVAGSPDYDHAGIYRNGQWQMMPGGAQVTAINANGDAVGTANYIDQGGKPYFYPAGGGDPVRLDEPFETGLEMQVSGIDSGGLIFGMGYKGRKGTALCVLWRDFVPEVLDTGKHECWSAGINPAGQLAGTVTVGERKPHYGAFVMTNGVMQRTGTPAGFSSTFATGINASGHLSVLAIRHETHKNAPHHGAYWDGTAIHDLGTFDGLGDSTAGAINDLDEVVGVAHDADGADHAYVWRGAGLVALAPLVDGAKGWDLGTPTAINAAGVITGSGTFQRRSHAYMLVPE